MAVGMGLTQINLTAEHDWEMDEFKCLTLNICAPKVAAPAEGFPVLVWTHG